MTELSSVIEFEEDLANVEAPKPLPAGLYDATIQTAEPQMSKDGTKLMAKVVYSISADQYPVDYTDGNPNGTTLTQYIMLGKDARSKYALKKFIMGIGAPLSNTVDLTTWIGLACKLEVVNELYEGMETARVKGVVA
jgi:hypothetical protein